MATSSAIAQVQTTPNVITTTVQQGLPGVQQSWTGFVNTTSQGGGLSGGNVPGYNPSTGQFMFGYAQGTFAYSMAINSALSGSGVQIGGIEYGLTYFNQDMSRGTLSVTATVTSNNNSILQSYTDNLPQTTNGWTQWARSQVFTSPYSLANVGNATLSFTGKDDRFWAGYYGPQFKDPYLRFNYTVDPCIANPRYSPSCPGYSVDNWYTGNVTSVYGTTFAINQALNFGDTGIRVHSVNWGYDYNIGGRYCSGWNLLGLCFGWSDSYVGGAIAITDNNANVILTDSNHTSGENITGSFRREVLLGNTSRDISTLGAASISTYTGGIASVTPYMGFNFTPDICNSNPLSNPQCPGYAAAYFTQQCTANPLYNTECPGYAAAYFTQQCTINPLYNPACPGYAVAYYNQQCTINPLYHTGCPGYDTAYLNQQCNANPLYSTRCAEYQTATTQCAANPLYASYCPSYQTATTQCAANSLYASYCPGYTTAQATCSTNPLSNTLCVGYTVATNSCNANQLTYSYCPSYTTTLAACGSNPQSNTLCPGYNVTSSGGNSGGTGAVSKTEAVATISSDGTVSTTVSKTGDSNVDKAISSPTTSTSAAAAPAAPVQLTQQTNQQTVAAVSVEKKQEEKKDASSTSTSSSSTTQNSSSDSGTKSEQPKTARQELQERRVAAARANAIEQGKQLAENVGKAASLEQQVAVQNVVIAAMGYTPGFDAYNKAIIPDGVGYKPFSIYNNQKNVDNARVGRGLFGPADRLHNELVDSQYKK